MSPRQGTSGRARAWPARRPKPASATVASGVEALIDQLEQAHAPGFGVAMVLQTQQVAIGRRRIDAHEHRVTGLEDLIVGTDAHAAKS